MTEIQDMDPLARDVPVWTAEQYRDARGTEIGVTSWQEVSQERVSAFGVATEDRNYIHMTPEKARTQAGPWPPAPCSPSTSGSTWPAVSRRCPWAPVCAGA